MRQSSIKNWAIVSLVLLMASGVAAEPPGPGVRNVH
jgi:hypothetical protein